MSFIDNPEGLAAAVGSGNVRESFAITFSEFYVVSP